MQVNKTKLAVINTSQLQACSSSFKHPMPVLSWNSYDSLTGQSGHIYAGDNETEIWRYHGDRPFKAIGQHVITPSQASMTRSHNWIKLNPFWVDWYAAQSQNRTAFKERETLRLDRGEGAHTNRMPAERWRQRGGCTGAQGGSKINRDTQH